MLDIVDDVERWFSEGKEVALAQVVRTWGSSPRVPGSVMAVSADGRLAGSVSGGCIEGAVAQIALDCLERGRGSLEEFHASTARAHEVGLSCGGSVDVLVAPLHLALFATEAALVREDREYLRVGAIAEGGNVVTGSAFLIAAAEDAEDALERAGVTGLTLVDIPDDTASCALVPTEAGTFSIESEVVISVALQLALRPRIEDTGVVEAGGASWFFARRFSQPQLVCIGGVHIAIHLCRMAKALGYRTIVVDPRRVFATTERFPFVDELVHAWPQEAFEHIPLTPQTALCALTHHPKIDVPALARGLESRAFYLGSLGRPTTQLVRACQLADLGFGEDALGRVFGPIGLDLRGREPAEIALAIMAEITAVRHGGTFPMSTMLEAARKARTVKQKVAR